MSARAFPLPCGYKFVAGWVLPLAGVVPTLSYYKFILALIEILIRVSVHD